MKAGAIMKEGIAAASGHGPVRPALPRVALVCDFLEERWPSMDLFGDMLYQNFHSEHAGALQVELLRPALRPRFSRLRPNGAFWNADRLINRFRDYPAWLKQRAARFDVFHLVDHSYSQLILDLPAERAVVTCHDLDTFNCVLEPSLDPRPRWYRAMAQRSLNGFLKAAQVICVSAFTRAQVLRHGLFAPDRISVIPPGADPVFFAGVNPDAQASVRAFLPGRPYLLHVGSTIPRKRLDILLRVFAGVARAVPELRLVRVGGALTEGQQRLADELGIAGRIVQAPYLSKQQVAAVYGEAALVLQTSDAEGFGLPVIEAMACGCPVIASDIPPLREAGGTEAEYCGIGEIEAWTETAVRLIQEREKAPEAWKARQMRARNHASRYTWKENAKQTISVYGRVCPGFES